MKNLNILQDMRVTVIGSLILVVSFVIIGISMSFAYFTGGAGTGEEGDKSLSITSGGLRMDFATLNNKYISATAASLINDADVLKNVNDNHYTEFSITLPTTTNEGKTNIMSGKYSIFLTDFKMTENYKSTDVKWALCREGATTLNDCTRGDFSGAQNSSGSETVEIEDSLTTNAKTMVTLYKMNNFSILQNQNITRTETAGNTVQYKFYVWLSSRPGNQNSLLNGYLTGKIAFIGTSKTD